MAVSAILRVAPLLEAIHFGPVGGQVATSGLPGLGQEEQKPQRRREPKRYVTLSDMAAMVNRSKKQMKRYLNDPEYKHFKMPQPDDEGRGGKPHRWLWSKIRPWLRKTFHKYVSFGGDTEGH